MLSKIINSISFISVLLIFTLQLNAQKSITGIVTEEISTKDGKFLLHRTTHLPKGKTISGTVRVEPDSDKTKKREKQIANLKKYILKIGDQIIGNDGIFTIKLPDIDNIPLQVFTSEGKLVQEISFELSEPLIPENLKMPKTIRKDFAEKITGDFSGDISNANILLDEKPVDILAGNDTELFFKVEDIEPGKQDLSLEYDDIKVTELVNVVDYTLQAGRLNLNRGESTYLDVKIVGLEDLQEPLELKVQNQSVGTIRLEGGDIQTIQITPSEVAETGIWQKRFDIQSLTRGSFNIYTELEITDEYQQAQPLSEFNDSTETPTVHGILPAKNLAGKSAAEPTQPGESIGKTLVGEPGKAKAAATGIPAGTTGNKSNPRSKSKDVSDVTPTTKGESIADSGYKPRKPIGVATTAPAIERELKRGAKPPQESEKGNDISEKKTGQIVDREIDDVPVLIPSGIWEKLKKLFDFKFEARSFKFPEVIFRQPKIELIDFEISITDNNIEGKFVLHESTEIRGVVTTIFDLETDEIVIDSIFQLIENTIPVILNIPENAGVYKLQMDVIYANNQSVSFIRYINQIPVISPDAIALNIRTEYENIRDRITDDIERIEGELEDNNGAQDNNKRDARNEDWEAAQNNEVARQLEEIDFVLDEVSEIYSETLRELIDTLLKYEADPPKPDLDALNSQVEELEAALAACKEQLARLEELQKQIPEQIENLENQYKKIYDEMIELLNAAGYRYENAGYQLNSGRYGRPILLMGWCGYVSDPMSDELTRSTNRAFNEAAPISRQHRRLMTRLAELPQQIAAVTAQCNQLAAELDAAKEALLNAENNIEAYETFVTMLNNSRNEICRQIKNILDRLEQWCNNHPDISSELSEMIDDFMRNCPQSERELREFWQNWETVLSTKQGIETEHREEAESHAENAENFRDENDRLREESSHLENQLDRLNRELRDAVTAYRQALADARRERAEARRREIEEKAACLRILTEHWENNSDENSVLGELASIYETFAGTTSQGPGGYSEMLDKLNELNSKLSEMRDQIEQVASLLNGIMGEPTNEDRTEAFQEVLDIAGEIGNKVPGFGEMIGFYADAYEAAIGAIMEISNQKIEAMKPLVNRFGVGNHCPQSDWGDKTLDQILNDKWDKFMSSSEAVVVEHRLTDDEQEKLKEYFKQKITNEILACCLNKISE